MKIASGVVGACMLIVAVAAFASCGDEPPKPGSADGGAPTSNGTGASTSTTPVATGKSGQPPAGGW